VKLYAAIYYDTDGFTYSCDTVLGVYDERSKADERCLEWAKKHRRDDLSDFRVDEFELNTAWFE
jgi:hypothetical protein